MGLREGAGEHPTPRRLLAEALSLADRLWWCYSEEKAREHRDILPRSARDAAVSPSAVTVPRHALHSSFPWLA